MTAITLEDALRKIAADNDVRYISIDINLDQGCESARFGACVQWHGASTTGNPCASAHGNDAASALTLALAEARVRRGLVSDDLPAISGEGLAA